VYQGGDIGLRQSCEGGFTLIEIMLVILIISVMTMMIAPSFFSSTGATPGREARRLTQALRLASDEAALTGRPMRWLARSHGYSFEMLNGSGVWQSLGKKPYAAYKLPVGIEIADVRPASAFMVEQANNVKQNAAPVLARLLLLPWGIAEPARIVLAEKKDNGEHVTVLLRPGPGGIAIQKGKGG